VNKNELSDSIWVILFKVFIPNNFNFFYLAIFVGVAVAIGTYVFISRHTASGLDYLTGYGGGYVAGMIAALLTLAIYNFFDPVWCKNSDDLFEFMPRLFWPHLALRDNRN
jgi:hypothetical protein